MVGTAVWRLQEGGTGRGGCGVCVSGCLGNCRGEVTSRGHAWVGGLTHAYACGLYAPESGGERAGGPARHRGLSEAAKARQLNAK